MKERPISLTRRERAVLVELCRPSRTPQAFNEPTSTREIASALFVTEAAVKQHLLRLYDKLEIFDDGDNRRVRLANVALDEKIVTDADFGAPDIGSSATPPTVRTGSELARAGHLALRRKSWREAYEALAAAERKGELTTADDLAALGEAALWAGEPESSREARLRAYQAYVAEGNERRAAVLALGLVINFAVRLRGSVAAGWLGKAARHLEGQPVGREQALLAATEGLALVMSGDFANASGATRLAIDLGRSHGDRDAAALGQVFHADVLMYERRPRQAAALYDEAMASATAGDLGPLATGLVYCRTICSCLNAFDFKRAFEWTEMVEESKRTLGEGGFTGDCRAHRASIFAMRGESSKAAEEARVACTEAEVFDLTHVGMASYELGEILLRAGDLEGAERAFERASELGMVPEPGRSLVLLARGNIDAARASLTARIAEAQNDPLPRARLRPTEIEIALLQGRIDDAREALADLESIATDYTSHALSALATHARGCVALAEGRCDAAIADLRVACHRLIDVEMALHAARARVDLGRALRDAGSTDLAKIEFTGAESTLKKLGAKDAASIASNLSKSLG